MSLAEETRAPAISEMVRVPSRGGTNFSTCEVGSIPRSAKVTKSVCSDSGRGVEKGVVDDDGGGINVG